MPIVRIGEAEVIDAGSFLLDPEGVTLEFGPEWPRVTVERGDGPASQVGARLRPTSGGYTIRLEGWLSSPGGPARQTIQGVGVTGDLVLTIHSGRTPIISYALTLKPQRRAAA